MSTEPLVSILIRTIGDPHIEETVASALAQNSQSSEIILVAAHAQDIMTRFRHMADASRLRQILPASPLDRPAAANAALDAATGKYCLFLDDDDLILPGHIDALVQALDLHPKSIAAVSETEAVDACDGRHLFTYARGWDPSRLLAENLYPIHSVLFRRHALKLGCRFDESLPVLEDWDFWLQLARHGDFTSVAIRTAIYRVQHRSSAGRADLHAAMTERIHTKWLDKTGPALFSQTLSEFSRRLHDLEGRKHQWELTAEKHIQLHNDLHDRDTQIIRLHEELRSLYSSKSWRATAPLRAFTHFLRRQRPRLEKGHKFFDILNHGLRKRRQIIPFLRQNGVLGLIRRLRQECFHHPAPNRNYQAWIEAHDQLEGNIRADIVNAIEDMTDPVLISVIMPVYNPEPHFLAAAIASVQAQLYPHWELCICDDASTSETVQRILSQAVAQDSRIKLVRNTANGHICVATNNALALASGAWVTFLDHDDVLAEHALYHIACEIRPGLVLIYSDEDKIDEAGVRYDPYFKPEFDPFLMRSHNLITHLMAAPRAAVLKTGGMREGFEGAQDYDLFLRMTEGQPQESILHIPRILYHWRSHAQSTAASIDAKPYALIAGKRAMEEHLYRVGIRGRVEAQLELGMYRVRYAPPVDIPLVSIIIPTKDRVDLLSHCLDSILLRTTYPHFEIVIVDNGSVMPESLRYLERIARDARVRVHRDVGPFNFSRLVNAGSQAAKGSYLCLLNNDMEVIAPGWLEELLGLASQSDVGAAGARLLYADGTLQHGGIILGIAGIAGHLHRHLPREHPGYMAYARIIRGVSAVTGACLMVGREHFEAVGGFDETTFPVAFNDVDFCLRLLEKGLRNVWTPHAELFHYESATRGYEDTPEKQARFKTETERLQRRWGHRLHTDRHYSQNLTLDAEDMSLAWPPRIPRS